jgi:hypothetical protein
MLRANGIALDGLGGLKVDCVKAEALAARYLRESNLKVAAKLIRRSCATGIITTGLDSAGQFAVRVLKALYIVALPTLNRNRNLIHSAYCRV